MSGLLGYLTGESRTGCKVSVGESGSAAELTADIGRVDVPGHLPLPGGLDVLLIQEIPGAVGIPLVDVLPVRRLILQGPLRGERPSDSHMLRLEDLRATLIQHWAGVSLFLMAGIVALVIASPQVLGKLHVGLQLVLRHVDRPVPMLWHLVRAIVASGAVRVRAGVDAALSALRPCLLHLLPAGAIGPLAEVPQRVRVGAGLF